MLLKTILCFSLSLSCFLKADRVAAIVGDQVVLESAVQEQVAAFLINSPSSKKEDVRKNVLDYLVEQEVLVYFAKKDSLLSIEDSQVASVVGERLDFFKKQLGSVEALESYFGSSFLEIRNALKVEAEKVLLADLFKRKLFSHVSISTGEVRVFYSTYKDSLPLTPFLYNYSCVQKKVVPSPLLIKETKQEALNVLNKVLKGARFDSFYDSFSGGDLGFFRRGTFIKEFEKVAFSLKEGEIGGPVLSPLGVHLVRLNQRLGEKIDVSHILFPLSVGEKDRDSSLGYLKEIKKTSLDLGVSFFDSVALAEKGSYSGVFKGTPSNLIPQKVLKSLDLLEEASYSSVIEFEVDVFGVIYLKSMSPPKTPDLYEFWGTIEKMALEKKFFDYYSKWYNKNKQKVYIKIKN